ncbi:MAG: DUF4382 domain-containing protein [Dehalococcoidia bacterium]|nr:DUF4382 domain-containing protein [Dehalococcoidia bacterium]
MRILKDVYTREAASADFKTRLRNRLAGEAAEVSPRPSWRRALWIPAAAAAALVLILVVTLVVVPAVNHPSRDFGTLQVRVTDAKNEPLVSHIYITFENVTVHRAGDGDTDGEWVTVADDLNKTVDLLQLSGIGDLLGEGDVEAGRYTQIRIGIVKVEIVVDGQEEEAALEPAEDAVLPSGELKFVRNFEVKADETTVLVIDFDVSAEKSVVFAGGRWLFKPTIKLDVTYQDE